MGRRLGHFLQTVPHHTLRPPRIWPYSCFNHLVYGNGRSRHARPQSKSKPRHSSRQFARWRALDRFHLAISSDGPPACACRRGSQRPAPHRLKEIRVPTLILVGDADIPDVHAHAGAIEAGIPGSKRVVVTDAGHLMYLEKPEEFSRVVIAFIDSSGPQILLISKVL